MLYSKGLKNEIIIRTLKTKNNKSQKEKNEDILKFKNSIKNRSQEEIDITKRKQSLAQKEIWGK